MYWNSCQNNPIFLGYFDRQIFSVCLNNDTHCNPPKTSRLKSEEEALTDSVLVSINFTSKIHVSGMLNKLISSFKIKLKSIILWYFLRQRFKVSLDFSNELSYKHSKFGHCCVLPRAYPSLFVHVRYVCMLCMLSFFWSIYASLNSTPKVYESY